MHTETITIGLVDDHTLVRQALRLLISSFENCEVTLEASNGQELQERMTIQNQPHLLLLDLQMPVMNGFKTLEWLHCNYPDLPVIIVSMCDFDFTISKLIHQGARAFLKKEICYTELKKAIYSIREHGYYFNDPISRRLLTNLYKDDQSKKQLRILLTEKEWIFLQLATTEMTYKQIAGEMKISARCVDKMRNHLFDLLHAKSRVSLARLAMRHGIGGEAA